MSPLAGHASSHGFDEPFVSDAEYEELLASRNSTSWEGPCSVLPQCQAYLEEHKDSVLRINEGKLAELTEELYRQLFAEIDQQPKSKEGDDAAKGLCAQSSPSADSSKEDRLCQIARILAYNVMNFSFFPDVGEKAWFIEGGIGKDDEAFAIVESLKRWEKSGHYEAWGKQIKDTFKQQPICWLDGEYLKSLTCTDLRRVFEAAPEAGELPLIELRLKCLHSLADGLYLREAEKEGGGSPLERFLRACEMPTVAGDGSPVCAAPSYSVTRFVRELCSRVAAFRDSRRPDVSESPCKRQRGGDVEAPSRRLPVEFAKRPQLTVGMLHGDGILKFGDMHRLTVFSDYRLPQLFRSKGVFELIADGGQDELFVLAHSPLETCLRAGTLVVAEKMRMKVAEQRAVSPADLDYFLWKTTVAMDGRGELQPFHKTRTFAY